MRVPVAWLLDLLSIGWMASLCLSNNCHIKIGVILPFEDFEHSGSWSLPKVKGGITYAIDTITNRSDLLPGCTLHVNYGDSQCSETFGPLEAVDMFYRKRAYVFLGPGCDYALAPIARFSPHWNIPVLTAGGMVLAFSKKQEFSQLTRIGGSYTDLGRAMSKRLDEYNWHRVGLIYDENQGRRSNQGHTNCRFIMESIYYPFRKKLGVKFPGEDVWYKGYDKHAEPDENLDNISTILHDVKMKARSKNIHLVSYCLY